MILVVSPALGQSLLGNGITTERWARILTELGHDVATAPSYQGNTYTMLVALHARKSAESVRRFRADHPTAPIVLALTGTDLYPDLESTGVDPAVLELADRLVVLQERGLAQLEPRLRQRARVIVQSMPTIETRSPDRDSFQIVFLSHLRAVKDPLLPAAACRLLPAGSRIRVVHAGEGIDATLAAGASAEARTNPRYSWVGPLLRDHALRLLASSRLLVLSSRHEGGANVISEALAARVPIVCSRIPGSVGLLGPDYPGYFPPGDAEALARLLHAAETDTGYYGRLADRCRDLADIVRPDRERDTWTALLEELAPLAPRH